MAHSLNIRMKYLTKAVEIWTTIRTAYAKYQPLIVAVLAAMSAFGIIAPDEATALRDIFLALVI